MRALPRVENDLVSLGSLSAWDPIQEMSKPLVCGYHDMTGEAVQEIPCRALTYSYPHQTGIFCFKVIDSKVALSSTPSAHKT